MDIISGSVANPVKVAVGVLLVVLFGIIAVVQMPMQLTPDVERPTVNVTTTWAGASPKEIETEIIQRQEEQLQNVEGLTSLTSTSRESTGSITLEFQSGTDMDEAVLRVNTLLQKVRDYPLDADRPAIFKSDPTGSPIARYIIGPKPPTSEQVTQFLTKYPQHREALDNAMNARNTGITMMRLNSLADEYTEFGELVARDIDVTKYREFAIDNVEPLFERVTGVANCEISGGQDEELQIIVDPKKLASRGLTIPELRTRISQQNVDVSAGDISEGKRRLLVRTLGRLTTLEQVENVLIAAPNGQPIYVKDVAKVEMGFKKPTGFVRRFGASTLSLNVQRKTGANVLEIVKNLEPVQAKVNKNLLEPRGLVLTKVYDETEYINSAIGLVNGNIILGSALTVLCLMTFLHLETRTLLLAPILMATSLAALIVSPYFFILTLAIILITGFWFARSTLVISLAIPISFIGTFLIMYQAGRTLNVISLAGLAFASGMLVDNAIVVLENIYKYYQQGDTPFNAAKKGALEVWGAVLASTLTTLVVFIPILFLQGEVGQLFADIAIAISAAVGLSLVVSVLVIPAAAARILSNKDQALMGVLPDKFVLVRLARIFTGTIARINRWSMQGWGRQVSLICFFLLLSLGLSYLYFPKVEYLPSGNRNLVICQVIPPPGYNLAQLIEMGVTTEDVLRPYWDFNPGEEKKLDYPAINDFFVFFEPGRSMIVGARSYDPLKASKLVNLLQDKLADRFPGTNVFANQASLFERGGGRGGGRRIDIEIRGPELERLIELGTEIQDLARTSLPQGTRLQANPTLDMASPELHVFPRPVQTAELGISNADLGYSINALIDGAYAGDFYAGEDRIDIVIMGGGEQVLQSQDLQKQYVAVPGATEPVRVDAVARVELSSGPEQVAHRERERAITITAALPPTISLEEGMEAIESKIVAKLEKEGKLSGGYQLLLTGAADKLREVWMELRWNLIVAVLITYLLMAALFESWIYPFIILVSVPLGGVGGVLGLKLLSVYLGFLGEAPQNLDVLTMLGFVILVGTVVNNAILIVHQALIHIREDGMSATDGMQEAAVSRIRPIMMTTLTTLLGLAPLVFFPGAGSELYRGLGSVLLGGLLISTLFTLILVPALFVLCYNTGIAIRSRLGLPLAIAGNDSGIDATWQEIQREEFATDEEEDFVQAKTSND